jgi:uncharacterized protein (DUF58 family)
MAPQTENATLLTAAERRQLERLRFSPRRRFAGRMRGERISKQKGISIEFSDFRDYSAGDDLRRLDWNILARLGRPTIRTFQDEDDLAVHVLLDMSASMEFGHPPKIAAGRKAAAALAFVGLVGQDAVYAHALGASHPRRARALRGRSNMTAVERWLGAADAAGTAGLATSLSLFAASAHYRPGLTVLISDGLDPDAGKAIRALGARGHEVLFVQVLSALELDPEVEGDLRLLDSETGEAVEMTAHAEALRMYKSNLAAHCETVADAAASSGGRYLRLLSHEPVVETCLRELRRIGAVE